MNGGLHGLLVELILFRRGLHSTCIVFLVETLKSKVQPYLQLINDPYMMRYTEVSNIRLQGVARGCRFSDQNALGTLDPNPENT